MKKFLKVLSLMLVSLLCFCCLFGCAKAEPTQSGHIPNGRYHAVASSNTYVYNESENLRTYWEIKGDRATFYFDNWLDYKAKIVEKDGIIYFECYKWHDLFLYLGQIFSGEKLEKNGSTNIYLVEYNAEENSITVELYKRGE